MVSYLPFQHFSEAFRCKNRPVRQDEQGVAARLISQFGAFIGSEHEQGCRQGIHIDGSVADDRYAQQGRIGRAASPGVQNMMVPFPIADEEAFVHSRRDHRLVGQTDCPDEFTALRQRILDPNPPAFTGLFFPNRSDVAAEIDQGRAATVLNEVVSGPIGGISFRDAAQVDQLAGLLQHGRAVFLVQGESFVVDELIELFKVLVVRHEITLFADSPKRGGGADGDVKRSFGKVRKILCLFNMKKVSSSIATGRMPACAEISAIALVDWKAENLASIASHNDRHSSNSGR